MNIKDEILKELRETSPLLAQISRRNVFAVPVDYFEKLGERICLYTILNQNIKEVISGEFNPSQQVPQGYFDQLSDSILSKIKGLEATELSVGFPLLDAISKENVYTIPEAYFENLSKSILVSLPQIPKAKVISFTKSAWWKYAAAAFFAGIMMISAFLIFNSGSKDTSVYLAATKKYNTINEIHTGIASLPEEEIIQYLEINSRSSDNDLLLKEMNTEDLPSEIDYLLDENALNNYLNTINFDTQ